MPDPTENKKISVNDNPKPIVLGDKREPPGHEELAAYFSPRYKDLTVEQVTHRITTDKNAFESSLKLFYDEKSDVLGGRDFQTFRAEYLKKYGDPFGKPRGQLGTEKPKPPKAEDKGYSWSDGAQNTKLAEGQYAESKDPNFDPEGYDRLIAYQGLKARRDGDYITPGDDHAIKISERPEYIEARLSKPSVSEYVGKTAPVEREYKYRTNAIKDEVDNIDKSLAYLNLTLKQQYGEDFITKIQTDPEFAASLKENPQFKEWQDLSSLRKANVDKFISINKEKKYTPMFSQIKENEVIQLQRDISVDPREGVENYLIRLGGRTLAGIGAIGEITEELLSGNKTYGPTDVLWDYLQDAATYAEENYPKKSKNARGLVTDTVDYTLAGTPVEIDFDSKGNVASVRYKNGDIIPNAGDLITDEDIAEINKLEKRKQYNWAAGINTGLEVVGDLGVQVLITKGVAGALGKIGASEAVASRMGVTSAVMVQTANPLLKEGKELFPDDPNSAAAYALSSSVLIGLSANLFGMESKLAGGPGGFLDDIFGSKIRRAKLKGFVKGKNPDFKKLTTASAADAVQLGLGETFEEVVLESLVKTASKLALGAGVSDEIDWNNVIETAAISMAVGMLGGTGNVSTDLSKVGLEIATDNPLAYRQELTKFMAKPENLAIAGTSVTDPNKDVKVQQHIASESARVGKLADQYKVVAPLVNKNIPKADVLNYLDARNKGQVTMEQQVSLGLPVEVANMALSALDEQIVKLQDPESTLVPRKVIEGNDLSQPISLPQTPEASPLKMDEVTPAMVPSIPVETVSIERKNDEQGDDYWSYINPVTNTEVRVEVSPEGIVTDEAGNTLTLTQSPLGEISKNAGTLGLDELLDALTTIFPKTSQIIRAKFDAIRNRIRKGDEKAKVDLMNESKNLRNEVKRLSTTDEVVEARNLDEEVTKQFDAEVKEINTIAKAKGIPTPLSARQQLVPESTQEARNNVQEAEYVLPEVVTSSNIGAAKTQLKAIKEVVEKNPDDKQALDASTKLSQKIKAYKKNKTDQDQLRLDSEESATAYLKQESEKTTSVHVDETKKSMGFIMDTKFIKFLYGLVGGKTPVELKIAIDKFKSMVKYHTTGFLPTSGLNLNVERISAINAHMKKGALFTKQLKRRVKDANLDLRDPNINTDLNSFMKDPNLKDRSVALTHSDGTLLNDDIRASLIDMRNHIDELSQMLVASGVTDGPLADVITDNMTIYLHRSYQIHNDPDWVEKVTKDPDIWNPGVAWWSGVLNNQITNINEKLDEADTQLNKYTNQLTSINPISAPVSYKNAQDKHDYWKKQKEQLEDDLDIAESKLATPSASLSAHLKEKQNTQGSGSQLGGKELGILQMRGGKKKKDAVKKAYKEIKKKKDLFQKKQKAFSKLHKKNPDSEESKIAEVERDAAWDKLQEAEGELAEAFDMDIPVELRRLYGEYDSALVNYMHTIYKQSALAANHDFLVKIRESGLKEGWLHPATSPQPGFDEKIAADASSVMSPLNGLYTSKDIKSAFENYNQAYNLPGWMSAWVWASGLVKKWLTVYSPVGNIRNIVSGGYFHALSGDFLASPAGVAMYANGLIEGVVSTLPENKYIKSGMIGGAVEKAAAKVRESDKAPAILKYLMDLPKSVIEANRQAFTIGRDAKTSKEQDVALYEELVSLGLTDESVSFGLIKDSLDQFKNGFTSPYTSISTGQAMQLGRGLTSKVKDFAQDTYQASDSAHRILRYMRDLNRYAVSRKIPLSELAPGKSMDFKREVARISRRTYPTYSRMPKIISALGKSPAIGPFISFHYTAAEAAVNNVDQAITDFKNGDIAIGWSRLLGVVGSNITYGLMLKGVGGVIIGGALGLTSSSPEDEDTDENKWTYFLPEWSKYSKVTVFPTGEGEFKYVDHGAQIPNATIFEMIESLTQGNFDRAQKAFEKEILGPFVSAEVFATTAMQALLNQKNLGSGRKIYQEKDDLYTKMMLSLGHMANRLAPGFITTLRRIGGAMQNYRGEPNYEDYKDYDLGVELITAGTGLRVSNGSAATTFRYAMNDTASNFNDALNTYRSKARNLKRQFPNLDKLSRQEKLKWNYDRAERLATENVEYAIKLYEAAIKTGVPRSIVEDMLDASRLPPKTREGVKRGIVVLPEIDKIK
jgi:hypothetical protein